MAKLAFVAALFGLTAGLTGCASNIEQLRNTTPSGGTAFTQALASEYRDFTLFEADEMYDWPDADYFARKGLAAAGGEVVLPEDLANWDLPQSHVGELTDARARLISVLDGGARDSNPTVAARAQAKFDCWVEQQEENHQADHIAACRDEFLAAMEELEGKPMPADVPGQYIVLFDFDRYNIRPDAQAVIDQVLADAAAKGVPVNISAIGHADTAGPEDYNMALSLRRADSVREALIAGGIDPNAITVAGRGETELAVPTPDNTPEQANRRVEIVLQ
jgi:OOP family OmpA-OmpF porin